MRKGNCYTQGPPPHSSPHEAARPMVCASLKPRVRSTSIGREATGSSGIVRLVARAVDAQRFSRAGKRLDHQIQLWTSITPYTPNPGSKPRGSSY